MVGSRGRLWSKPHVHRNTLVRHDVLDVARIFIDVVAVVLGSRVYPLPVVTIEFVFIIGGEPRLPVRKGSA
jgi:hypothetical protein